MRVEVVRDLTHDAVGGPGPGTEHLVGHPAQLIEHVVKHVLGRLHGVLAPHDHGNGTHLALGDPAHLVLVVPGGEPCRLAQVAAPAATPPVHRWSYLL